MFVRSLRVGRAHSANREAKGAHPQNSSLAHLAMPLRKYVLNFSRPLHAASGNMRGRVYSPIQTGMTVMPDDEKQVLEGIRRNVIEMNRRLHDISRLVGVTVVIDAVACILLLLILWRNW